MKVHDHGSIVWDEFAGFWITMAVVPLFNIPVFDWKWILTGVSVFHPLLANALISSLHLVLCLVLVYSILPWQIL